MKNWLTLMRAYAADLNFDDREVKDADLQCRLDEAERKQNLGRVYRAGDKLQATEPTFLLDGLIQLGQSNVIVGQPKVGKSSFSCGLVAALRDRQQQFLGRDLSVPIERMPVLIFGTDQAEGNWLHFLRRENLVNEDQSLNGDAIDFFCSLESSDTYNFTRNGLQAMREEIEKYQYPLVVIDSLSSMMEPTGIEENTARFAKPIRDAIGQLSKTGATLLIIHHSIKRVQSWDWITECRGSSSISSVFSWGVLMRWVSQEEDGLARTDRRVGFVGKGRGKASQGGALAEYMDQGGWQLRGSLELEQHKEQVKQRINQLGQTVRASVFDVLSQRREMGSDMCADEIATELNKKVSNVGRELMALNSLGLIDCCRLQETGARPRKYWELSDAAKGVIDGDVPAGHTIEYFDPFANNSLKSRYSTLREAENSNSYSHKNHGLAPRTPVEIKRGKDGEWESGYIVYDGSNPDAIIVSKTFDPNRRIRNLRLDLDVRECSSPYSTPKNDDSDLPAISAGTELQRKAPSVQPEREVVETLDQRDLKPDFTF